MSLDEYNRHATFGPSLGPATNAAASAGQDAYNRAHARPAYHQAQAANSPASHGAPPRWVTHGAFKRGLIFVVIAWTVITLLGLYVNMRHPAAPWIAVGAWLVFFAGAFQMLCGAIVFLAGLRGRGRR